jgi:hypothetical protein
VDLLSFDGLLGLMQGYDAVLVKKEVDKAS